MFAACRTGNAQVLDSSLTIRVESRRVLVPVGWDVNISCVGTWNSSRSPNLSAGNLRSIRDERCLWDNDVIDGVADIEKFDPFAMGLFKKFRLFEDGKEQKIESVDRIPNTRVRKDNLGVHFEDAAGAMGFWSTSDENSNVYRDNTSSHKGLISLHGLDHYQIAYMPPPSPTESCHKIRIKAAKYGSHLAYEHKYCSVFHSSYDPLLGTDVGRELEQYIASGEPGSIHPRAKANYFYLAPHRARVQIDIELPFDEVRPRKASDRTPLFNLLIAARATSGTAILRESVEPRAGPAWVTGEFADVIMPTRYDGQMELSSGGYEIGVSIRQGPKKFGVTEVPLRVDDYDGKELGISSIAVCKRVSKAEDKPVAVEFVPLVTNGYEFTPAANTHFHTGDSVMVYFELYEPLLSVPQSEPVSVKFQMSIADAKTGAVLTKTELNAASWIQQGKSTIPIAVKPVLDKLAPGNYRLEVQASDSAGRSTPLRAAELSIE